MYIVIFNLPLPPWSPANFMAVYYDGSLNHFYSTCMCACHIIIIMDHYQPVYYLEALSCGAILCRDV